MDSEIHLKLNNILRSNYGISDAKLKKSSFLVSDLELDSIDLVELVTDLEQEFDLEITDEEFLSSKNFANLDRLVKFIARKKG